MASGRDREMAQPQDHRHVEIVPGTEIMTDQRVGQNLLVPHPSEDPHDPLNWSSLWKTSAMVAASLVTFTQGFSPLALAPMIPYLIQDYNASLESVIRFTGVTILVLGFSNFIWIPLSSSFGRRPVLIGSQLVCLASHIWRAKATSYSSFMGAAVLSGIGSGPGETLQPAIIADLYFLHDRGKWNTLYWVVYMGALMVAPIISGAMADSGGWPNFWWLSAGLTGLSLLLVIFGYPETQWHREPVVQEQFLVTDAADLKSASSEKEEPQIGEKGHTETAENVSLPSEDPVPPVNPHVGKGSPSRAQWRPYQPNASPLQAIVRDIWTPWRLFVYPIVLFTSFVVSWSCSSLLILNITQSQVFSAPPYSWSAQSVGFTNFSPLVGAFIGLVTAGPLSDWISARATARNGGIREPEMRLPAMIPYVIVMALGNIITALGYSRGWPWQPIVIIGYASAGIQVAGLPAIVSTYAVDSYKPVAGALFVAVTVNKNLWGYGLAEFATSWSLKAGFIPVFMTNMALTLVWCLLGLVFYYHGKTFRRWTRDSDVHSM